MKKLFLLLVLFCASKATAQTLFTQKVRFLEAGLLFGCMNYSGDLAEKSIHLSETQLGYGAFARYYFSNRFALKANLLAGSISGKDSNAKDADVQKRSFRFGADILEFSLVGEWYPMGLYRFSDVGVHRFFVAPYLYVGLGAAFGGSKVDYYGDPAELDNILITALPEFASEQRFLLMPAGFGARSRINEIISVGLEAGVRPVFTDKLDGVSLNGNPKKKDWYYFGGASVAFILGHAKKPW